MEPPTPTLNVNLTPCTCPAPYFTDHLDATGNICPGGSVHIPCPVRRSVTFSVVLGECACGNIISPGVWMGGAHHVRCPARPVNVLCSISGKTWAESEPDEAEHAGSGGVMSEETLAKCRDRWAPVKALLSGMDLNEWSVTQVTQPVVDLWNQRDTVFAALADMARAEQSACNAQQRVDDAFPFERYNRNYADHRAERPSVGRLAAYVDYLIASVNTL